MYEVQAADGVQLGTKIVIHLKTDSREFSDEDTVRNIIQKYSNFVGSPIYLNGKKANTVQPLWLMDSKSITTQQHGEFYRYISNNYDLPRYTLHYNTDVPLSIHALLYFPDGKPGKYYVNKNLYCLFANVRIHYATKELSKTFQPACDTTQDPRGSSKHTD